MKAMFKQFQIRRRAGNELIWWSMLALFPFAAFCLVMFAIAAWSIAGNGAKVILSHMTASMLASVNPVQDAVFALLALGFFASVLTLWIVSLMRNCPWRVVRAESGESAIPNGWKTLEPERRSGDR